MDQDDPLPPDDREEWIPVAALRRQSSHCMHPDLRDYLLHN